MPEACRGCAGFIKGWLEAREIDVHDSDFGGLPVHGDRRARPTAPTLVFHGHFDVVPGTASSSSRGWRATGSTAAAPTT